MRAAASPETGPPASADSIERPDPGLARGRWEGPSWMFALIAAAALLGGLAWIAVALRSRRAAR